MTTPSSGDAGEAGETARARYTYRLRASSTAADALLREWDRCRWVWNECVAKARQTYLSNRTAPDHKLTCGAAQLDKMLTQARARMPWLSAGASVPQQQTIRDFAKSRTKALKDIKDRVPARQRAGMPRMRKRRVARPTLNYTRNGFRLKSGRLHVFRDSLGHWYAAFVVSAQIDPLPATGRVIGVDWGVSETATTTSDAHDLPHAQHGKTAAKRLARHQRAMARRKPVKGQAASRRYRAMRHQAAKLQKKVARQRQDTARKWAKAVVRDHDVIAVEDFRPKFLATSSMARKAADAAIGATKQALLEMGRKHGRDVRLVNPAHTTMDCAACGARAKHALPLSERTYTCLSCGAVSSRDKNSARVMLVRAGLSPAGADGVRPSAAPLSGQPEPEISSPAGRKAVNWWSSPLRE
ncbi:transposase [Kribbella sp. NPDC050459]|uniref:RNA-guided endonuclease InsQ/TnpB family protein n=1 Tax=Kribbella sp. NPDC050459 TaxID=3155785 RepID=UPI0033EAC178